MVEETVEVGGEQVRVTIEGKEVSAERVDEVEAVLVSDMDDEVHIKNLPAVDIEAESKGPNPWTARFNDEDVANTSPYNGNPKVEEVYDRDFHFTELREP